MNFEFSEEQQLLREQARGFLTEHCPTTAVRAVLDGDQDWDAALWQKVAEMGWTATVIPEAYGGLGLSYYELAIIAEEMGRSAAPLPFSSSVYLASEAIQRFGTEAQKSAWLPRLAGGECVATVAMAERAGRLALDRLETRRSGSQISGTKVPVADASIAEVAVVLARSEAGLEACLVPLQQAGVSVEPVLTFDTSRGHSAVTFDSAEAEVLGDTTINPEDWESVLDGAAVLLAWEQLGLAETALTQARDYALQRFAFGRAIGSYQALQHRMVDTMMAYEQSKSLLFKALCEYKQDPAMAAETVHALKVLIDRNGKHVFGEAIQMHGGMGMTDELDIGHYAKRLMMINTTFGDANYHRNRFIETAYAA
ncbi:MAG: acyl-CoA dehydrogenase family protein [Luminiphilus sp.]